MEPVISIKNLYKNYGSKSVLKDINLEAYPAIVNKDNTVTDLFYHIHHVTTVKDSLPVPGKFAYKIFDYDHTISIKAAKRFIKNNNIRIVQ